MFHFLPEYMLFLTKTITIVVALLIIIGFIIFSISKNKQKEGLKIENLNKKFKKLKSAMNNEILDKKDKKKIRKEDKKKNKQNKKIISKNDKKRIFVLDFKGDIKASQITALKEAITAILKIIKEKDEVVIKIESAGGIINNYGLAASQLLRIRDRNISLTAIVDKIAASGGYLMACVADKIYTAPFAIIGSIGVVAQIPNFHKWLKTHNIDFEQITAGQYKRTLSLFGENTDKGRQKAQEDVNVAHKLFKDFVNKNRPSLDIDKVATGEHWHGSQALELGLVDKLITSDDYLLTSSEDANIFEINYIIPKKKLTKLTSAVKTVIDDVLPFNTKGRLY